MMGSDWWVDGKPMRPLASHSKVKVRILEDYLMQYIRVHTANPRYRTFRLDVIDGFAGGGIYADNSIGSPLAILDTIKEACHEAKCIRTSEFQADVKCHFVERNRETAECLRKTLEQHGFDGKLRNGDIKLYAGQKFEDVIGRILEDVRRHQRAGKAIFFLDQYGQSLPLDHLRRIRAQLGGQGHTEIILTLSATNAVNFVRDEIRVQEKVISIGKESVRISELISLGGGDTSERKWRAAAQRGIPLWLKEKTGYRFFVPFMLKSATSRRMMLVIHLADELRAREVMTDCLWRHHNMFGVYANDFGTGMLAYDALQGEEMQLLDYNELGREEMRATHLPNSLLPEMVSKLQQPSVRHLTEMDARLMVGNRSAASSVDVRSVVLDAWKRERVLEIRRQDGRMRDPRRSKHIHPTDRIVLPTQRDIFSFCNMSPSGKFPSRS